jgi:Zn-finger nucleic acid-binding protein
MARAGAEESGSRLCCRECGAPASALEKACAYCRSPLSTLQCAHCFGWNAPAAQHCLACGERLGLSRLAERGEPHAPCPRCRAQLVSYRDEDGQLWDCPSCEAQFVEHRLLDSLLAGRQRLPARNAIKPHPLPLDTKVTYHSCPHCAQLMNRRNFGGRSGIVVDVCKAHGVWFEAGELKLVLQFVESGGLAEARRRSLGLPEPLGTEEQERAAKAIAHSLAGFDARQRAPETSERWLQWAEARLDEVIRLYLSWSRR